MVSAEGLRGAGGFEHELRQKVQVPHHVGLAIGCLQHGSWLLTGEWFKEGQGGEFPLWFRGLRTRLDH